WQGATAGPTIAGIPVPWMAALHVDTAGAALGDILGSLNQQGKIGFSTTTVIGEYFGSYVGNGAAKIAGGLGKSVALDPASPLDGYLPPTLKTYFQHSAAYETTSLVDTHRPIAGPNQTLDTGDVNTPLLQHTCGVPRLAGQFLGGDCALLSPGSPTGPDALPPGNDPPPPSDPSGVVVSTDEVVQIASH